MSVNGFGSLSAGALTPDTLGFCSRTHGIRSAHQTLGFSALADSGLETGFRLGAKGHLKDTGGNGLTGSR